MIGRREGVGRLEVRLLEEQTAEGRDEEEHATEEQQEHADADQILDRVVRVEGDAVDRLTVRAQLGLDLDAVRVVGTRLAQGHEVHQDQEGDGERHRDDVQREEAVEGGVGDAVVAADPFDETGPDHRDGAEQVDDHLRTPVRHVAPGQHITHEGLGHQREVEQHAEDPQQLTRRAV